MARYALLGVRANLPKFASGNRLQMDNPTDPAQQAAVIYHSTRTSCSITNCMGSTI
ncbi:hypothetical protein [Paraburkholderia kirstenboschensis]|uniref:Uncharacterized protein n=1 Tax=Paraburkholderia kirstenboschensis TaxID=1245436 RepID=A0ABZ0EC27_9BURK|nr:hypothetical protein [Paraburkholderia kirstenboschensis]WOD14773.1 hypothetical protein RW095_05470 [Paraburkholderia kirstenboschensis]